MMKSLLASVNDDDASSATPHPSATVELAPSSAATALTQTTTHHDEPTSMTDVVTPHQPVIQPTISLVTPPPPSMNRTNGAGVKRKTIVLAPSQVTVPSMETTATPTTSLLPTPTNDAANAPDFLPPLIARVIVDLFAVLAPRLKNASLVEQWKRERDVALLACSKNVSGSFFASPCMFSNNVMSSLMSRIHNTYEHINDIAKYKQWTATTRESIQKIASQWEMHAQLAKPNQVPYTADRILFDFVSRVM